MIKLKEIETNEFLIKSKLPSSDYVYNPYVGCPHKCVYCYACFMKKFTNHLEPWGNFIDVKNIKNYKIPNNIKDKFIFISSVTDPYNAFENKYLKTRKALNILKDIDCKIGILTKSKLVLRDLDIIKNIKNIEVGISINSLDDNFRKLIEPYAGNVNDRLNTLKELRKNNIKNYLFMSPMFPMITDFKKIIEGTKDYVDYYCFENLNLRADYKFKVLSFINKNYPEYNKLYEDIYIKGNNEYWDKLENEIIYYCKKNNIKFKIYFHHNRLKKGK